MTSVVATQVNVAKLRMAAPLGVRIAAECGNAKLCPSLYENRLGRRCA